MVIWDFKDKENFIQRLIDTYILDDKKQLEEWKILRNSFHSLVKRDAAFSTIIDFEWYYVVWETT